MNKQMLAACVISIHETRIVTPINVSSVCSHAVSTFVCCWTPYFVICAWWWSDRCLTSLLLASVSVDTD